MDSRTAMPKVAEFIDSLRQTFGEEYINAILQRGIRGEPVFHASENGHEIGTVLQHGRTAVKQDERGLSYVVELNKDKK